MATLLGCALPAQAAHPALVELHVVYRDGIDSCVGEGVAIHLGEGLFLTAGHLVDPGLARREGCPGAVAEPERPPVLLIGGRQVPAVVLHRVAGVPTGDAEPGWAYPGWQDLALLRVATPPAGVASLSPCTTDPAPGNQLRVESLRRSLPITVREFARSGWLGPARIDGTLMVLNDALLPGESGGPVLGPGSCIAGVISARQGDPAGRLGFAVPAAAIRAFLGRR
ncbi:MAG TPA: hypothetical protein VGM87_13385 [Roseomonas sp.]